VTVHDAIDPLLVLVLLTNFFLLGTSRLRAAVSGSAVQGALLGVLAILVHGRVSVQPLVIAFGAVLLKSVVIPALLLRAMREAAIRREIEPVIGFTPSLLLGALGTGLALFFGRTMPLAAEHQGSLLVPASLATVLAGFLLLVTRRKAITQVVGYLILENGIFIMGLVLAPAMPFMVEIGVLLDLFVGIFVMGIMIEHISREFSSLDTTQLRSLKE
jgi:hydrogenase-4 component E